MKAIMYQMVISKTHQVYVLTQILEKSLVRKNEGMQQLWQLLVLVVSSYLLVLMMLLLVCSVGCRVWCFLADILFAFFS
jgi:hypothetical protein